ncbi:MAG: hypothetical protein HOU81_15525 [Hamadaea sp.]|uniref:hypothetical protein n=1 Tax=Hamadaea sp. TaxID=2024425 RepID=UPI0018199668|nr:hypothetical protein [Hamadaea sp.]NUR72223.1 hypothetical protein [Hamadaea sp.]NUT22116.1 hypothetical protein [Hamadaea sp.]
MPSIFYKGQKAATVLILLLPLASACSPRAVEVPPAGPPSKAATQPSLSPTDQLAVDQAWTAYQQLNTIYVKAAQTGVYAWNVDKTKRPLYPYAAGTYMSALERDLDLMREQGFVRQGSPQVTLRRVVSVSPTSIIVEVCVDDSGTDTVSRKTGKSVVKAGQNQRYPVTLRAGLYPDAKWRWVEARADRAASC